MNAFPAAVDQAGNGQFQLSDDFVLLFQLHRVGLDQGETEVRHVFVTDAFAVQRIEPDPGADLGVVVPQDGSQVPVTDRQLFDEFPGSTAIVPFIRQELPVFFPGTRYIADVVGTIKQRRKILDEVFDRVPVITGGFQLPPFDPVLVDNDLVIPFGNHVVPVIGDVGAG